MAGSACSRLVPGFLNRHEQAIQVRRASLSHSVDKKRGFPRDTADNATCNPRSIAGAVESGHHFPAPPREAPLQNEAGSPAKRTAHLTRSFASQAILTDHTDVATAAGPSAN